MTELSTNSSLNVESPNLQMYEIGTTFWNNSNFAGSLNQRKEKEIIPAYKNISPILGEAGTGDVL